MNILVIAPEFPPAPGGIGAYSYSVARSLARMRHRVIALTVIPEASYKSINYQEFEIVNINWLSRLPKIRFLHFVIVISSFLSYGAYIVKSRKIDLIYCTRWDTGISSRLISKLVRTPYVLVAHGTEIENPKGLWRKLLQFALKNAVGVFVLANRQRVNLLKLGVPDEKVHIIPMEIDVEEFNPANKCEGIASKLGLIEKNVILSVGRLAKRKGHDMVIRALPSVLERLPNAIYLIVGKGPEEQNLRGLADELDLSEKVIFAGFTPSEDLPKYYNTCDVFIMPSREVNGDIEGFGIVFLEANACCRPVIGGRSGGISDAVEDGVSGILVDPLKIDEISQALVTLLTDNELARRLGSQGRKRVEEKFSYSAVARKVNEVLTSIIHSK